jgi:hypothetical protein
MAILATSQILKTLPKKHYCLMRGERLFFEFDSVEIAALPQIDSEKRQAKTILVLCFTIVKLIKNSTRL